MADDNLQADTPSAVAKSEILNPADIEAKKTGKLNVALWFSYDAADTYFSQLIISLAFTPLALLLGIQMGWTYTFTFVIVSIFMAFSNLLIAALGPILGSISDIAGKRKSAVIMAASIMVASTAAITGFVSFGPPNFNFWMANILFVIANFCYQAGRMFYDAQIPFIAKTEQRSFTQAVGGSLSFIGSVLGVVTSMILVILLGKPTHIDTAIWATQPTDPTTIEFGGLRWMFLIGAVVIVIMSIPYLFHTEVENPTEVTLKDNFKQSRQAFRVTGKEIVKDRNSLLFFLGWFFITDAANTAILYMTVTIQGAVGYDAEVTNYVIFAGIGGSIIFAVLTGLFMNKFGPKMAFIINGISWAIAITIIIFAGLTYKTEFIPGVPYVSPDTTIIYSIPKWLMFFGAFFIGVGFGGIWIIGRQFIMELAPPSKLAQYGGFQKIAGRVSAIVSPLMYAGLIFAFEPKFGIQHAYRFALGSLIIFFIIGVALISFIRDPHKKYLAGERAPYVGLYLKDSEAAK